MGFGATLGLTETPPVGHNGSFRARLAQAVGDEDPDPEQEDDFTAPPQRIVATVAVWALVLGLGGMVVGGAAMVQIITGAPGWFKPAIVLIGLLGIVLTVCGFATARQRFMPWLMLVAATLVLAGGAVLVTNA